MISKEILKLLYRYLFRRFSTARGTDTNDIYSDNDNLWNIKSY